MLTPRFISSESQIKTYSQSTQGLSLSKFFVRFFYLQKYRRYVNIMRLWFRNVQPQYVILSFLVILTSTFSLEPRAAAQSTVSINDSTIISNTARAGPDLWQTRA